MTRTIEVSCPTVRSGSAALGVDVAPLSDLLAALTVDLNGARILQLGTRGCYGISDLLEAYRPSRLVAYQFGEARASASEPPGRGRAARAEAQPIPEPDGCFRAVFAYGLIDLRHHWPELLLEIARVLSPGGVLVVQAAEAGSKTAASFTRLAAALQQAGLPAALEQRLTGIVHVLIARRV